MMNLNDIYVNNEDKEMFLRGLIRLSRVDGIIAEEEVVFFRNVAEGMQLPLSSIQELEKQLVSTDEIDENGDSLKLFFDAKNKALFFIEEAVQLCYIDGVYGDKEQEEMKKIICELGLQQESLNAIEQWVQDGIVWQKKGEELLNLE